MFEARIKVDVGVTLCDELRQFIREDFRRGGHVEMTVQDVQEALVDRGREDLKPVIDRIRAEYGNLWLRYEWWIL